MRFIGKNLGRAKGLKHFIFTFFYRFVFLAMGFQWV
jgi:hypothetical protein